MKLGVRFYLGNGDTSERRKITVHNTTHFVIRG